jgi:hypothetical protein
MPSPPLTDELARKIVAGIRASGFPHVAAAAFDVSPALLRRWLRRRDEPYHGFAREVRQAQAQARLRAELAVLESDVRTWLKHGPGRDRPGHAGWAAVARPVPPPKEPMSLMSSAGVLQLLSEARTALALYPEALAVLTRALARERRMGGTP